MNSKSPAKVKPQRLAQTRIMREIQRVLDDPKLSKQQAMFQIKRAIAGVPPEPATSRPDDDPKGGKS